MFGEEIKRSIISKRFLGTCMIVLILFAFGSSDALLYVDGSSVVVQKNVWWGIYLYAICLGMKTLLPILYPIIVMIAYVSSYRREVDSGFAELIIMKGRLIDYLFAKYSAIAISAFFSMLIPALVWALICWLIGDSNPYYDYDKYAIHFALALYEINPGLYVVFYAFHIAVLGVVFAILGLGLSAVVKNLYVALFMPFGYAVFSSSILGPIIGKGIAVFDMMPLQVYYHTKIYPLGYWTVPIYELIILIVGTLLFFLGGLQSLEDHNGKKNKV